MEPLQLSKLQGHGTLKYTDLMSCIMGSQCVPGRFGKQVTQHKKGHVHYLRSPYIKDKDH